MVIGIKRAHAISKQTKHYKQKIGHTTYMLCTKCEQWKESSDFPRRSHSIIDRHHWCRACSKRYSAERWRKRQLHKTRLPFYLRDT